MQELPVYIMRTYCTIFAYIHMYIENRQIKRMITKINL